MQTHHYTKPRSALDYAKVWVSALRVRTLTNSFIPIAIGTAFAWKNEGQLNWIIAFLTLLCATFIQIGINLINDALDFKKGADNSLRIGFKRVTQSKLLPPHTVLFAGFACFALSFIFGMPVILHSGWPFIWVLGTSMLFGYLYTGGPYPLAYNGLSEFFVLIYFGLICTITPYYVQTHAFESSLFIAALQIGLLSTAIIATNNLRDIKSDAFANKKTLVVMLGIGFGRFEITLASLLPFALGYYWIVHNHVLAGLFPFLILPIVFKNLKKIWTTPPSPQFNDFFIKTALTHLLFGTLFIIGYVLE